MPYLLRSFVYAPDPDLKFSVRCPNCHRWIWCHSEGEGTCFCGDEFKIVFGRPNWDISQGLLCMDCGKPFCQGCPGNGSWRTVNDFQKRCRQCTLAFRRANPPKH